MLHAARSLASEGLKIKFDRKNDCVLEKKNCLKEEKRH